MPVLGAIDGGLLLQVVWVSFVAGVSVTILFSLTVLFAARSAEARRRGGAAALATVWAVLAVLSSAAFAGGVIYGVHVMLTKS